MTGMTDQTSFLLGANATFISELYTRYLADPASVDGSWAAFFNDLDDDARSIIQELEGASWAPNDHAVIGAGGEPERPPERRSAAADGLAVKLNGGVAAALTSDQVRTATLDSLRALMMIRVYRVRGHLLANLDPLGLEQRHYHPELDPASYGFTEADYERPIFINRVLGLETATLREILEVLHKTYCGTIAVEFMHIQDPDQKAWIQARIEGERNHTEFTVNGKRAILERLTAAETFERFLQMKYTGTKRFGIEGGEVLIPAIEQVLKRGGQLGLKEVVLGMAHRGRLNVLANVMQKPFQAIFSEFQGNSANPEDVQGSGDVKYHLGTSADREFDNNPVHLSLTANPSHLEGVNPVVMGKVRAKQHQLSNKPDSLALTDEDRYRVAGVLLHGDAAFAGQGVVAETLALSELKGYKTGGTIHFVINNQIGFTTNPRFSRSGPYPTDVAKMIQAPIFHANGDDPEAVVHISRIAIEFRQRFLKDVVVDIFCYRRHGHNEGDEPAFTQPLMYKAIKNHPTTRELYARQLQTEKVVTEAEGNQLVADFQARLEIEFQAATQYKPNRADWLEGKWSGLEAANESASGEDRRGNTSVAVDVLKEVGLALSRVPPEHDVNPKIARQLKLRQQAIESGDDIDWATAEALAFGTLCVEGTHVRLSGQDSGRGTFSHRHSVLIDQTNEKRYVPLNNIRPDQASFEVHDSPLSEMAVLGFEYGYTLADPHSLVLWEAQFGDFANTAQEIIDQFISSGESKWLRMSGLTLLLPHGYEGQGPEHSSARPERFLQQSGGDNWQVVNCTTPANFFHVLRRQMRRQFRKPLIVFTPKSLLRHKLVVSKLADFGPGSSFHRVLPEAGTLVEDAAVKRVVLCCGKVYYDLLQERENRGISDVALVRVEQLYPFPRAPLAAELRRYPNADVVWCQEEPDNMGAWSYIDRRIERLLGDIKHRAERPSYAGRIEAAAPATGILKRHLREQAALIDVALTVKA
ncbi:MAG: 2-oxoglutarate dehydrogenase E1 component [Azospirillaceae bacterium]|nr:2-oxoglutarate dehydrogenase E1 component [Azospirillaceae bacterium]